MASGTTSSGQPPLTELQQKFKNEVVATLDNEHLVGITNSDHPSFRKYNGQHHWYAMSEMSDILQRLVPGFKLGLCMEMYEHQNAPLFYQRAMNVILQHTTEAAQTASPSQAATITAAPTMPIVDDTADFSCRWGDSCGVCGLSGLTALNADNRTTHRSDNCRAVVLALADTSGLDAIPAVMVKYEKIRTGGYTATLTRGDVVKGNRICWRFNFIAHQYTNSCGNPNCTYIHACSLCGKWDRHPAYRCPEFDLMDYQGRIGPA